MSEPYIAQIMIFGFNFAPRNYAFCRGQIIGIAQNQALFSLIGTTYGGDGVTTFALPNLQGSGIVNVGQGPGLSNYDLGQQAGADTVTLTSGQIPQHTHQVYGYQGTTVDPGPNNSGWFGKSAVPGRIYSDQAHDQAFASQAITTSGGSLPHENQQPYLAMNYCIALYGIFPSRN